MEAQIFFDGACHNKIENNGKNPMGVGVVVKIGGVDDVLISFAPPVLGTSNVAEYIGLYLALKTAKKLFVDNSKIEFITIFGDSQLIINQINGDYDVRSEDLKLYYDRCLELRKRLKKIKIVHIRRDKNQQADVLSKQGLNRFFSG